MHPLVVLHRDPRRGHLGAPKFYESVVPPSESLTDLDALPDEQALRQALEDFAEAKKSQQLGIPGFDGAAVQDQLLQLAQTGQIDTAEFLRTFAQVGVGVACAATGAAALGPLCSQAGKVLGDALVGMQATPAGPGANADSNAFNATLTAQRKALYQRKNDIYNNLAVKFGSDPWIMGKIKALLDQFYPDKPQELLYVQKWGSQGGWNQQPIGVTGFFAPFYATLCWVGTDYTDECADPNFEFNVDWTGGNPKPFWVQKTLKKLGQEFLQEPWHINLMPQIDNTIASWATVNPFADLPNTASALSTLFVIETGIVWPALQAEFDRRLKAILVDGVVRSNEKLLRAVDRVTSILADRRACTTDACRKEMQAEAVSFGQQAEQQGVATALRNLQRRVPSADDKARRDARRQRARENAGISTATSAPSPLRPVVAVAGGGALLWVLYRLAKRYL